MTDGVSVRVEMTRHVLRALTTAGLASGVPRAVQRKGMNLAGKLLPVVEGTVVRETTVGGVPVERVTPPAVDPAGVLLYLHGGGYVLGSPRLYRAMVSRMASRLGVPAVVPDYRLAPEHPHPAALDDALAVYRALLDRGITPERIVLAGDSAGGGLALALAMRLREEGTALPAVIGMICPWLDLTLDIAGTRRPVPREPLLTRERLTRWAHGYTPDARRVGDPAISPLRGDLSGLPPLVLHSAGDDLLAGEAQRLADRAGEAGTRIDHSHYHGLWHIFHMLAGVLRPATEAVVTFADSLRGHLPDPTPPPRIGIVGAGMSGLCMAAKLRRAGNYNFTVYEKAQEVGGTWRENRYPGLTCDVPSRFYSYSFAPNPEWSHFFPPGKEIENYFIATAEDLGLREHIRFGSEMTSARWEDGRWRLRTADGHQDSVDVLVAATGVLHHPRMPGIDGLTTFAGSAFHSARWDHSVPLAGKRIAVIGTGSTGVQIITALSSIAGKLLVFQRTPQWILPLPNLPYSSASRTVLRRFPSLNKLGYRGYQRLLESTFGTAVVQPGWQRTLISTICRIALRLGVRDPDLRRKLHPVDQPMCKRLIMSGGYYAAIQRPMVDLVTERIERVEPTGVRTADGTLHEVDIIVLATGFDAHAFMRPMKLIGEHGLSIDDAWRNGPRAYRTVAVPGFPNYFMLIGPHSPIGNHSLIAIAETQTDFVLHWIDELRRGAISSTAPTPEATERFNAEMRSAMPKTVWTTGCNSWYLGADGLPELWPWTPARHREMLASPVYKDFEVS